MRLSCSVCLEEMTENAELVALTVCGHVFDAECITQCLRMNNKCPLCNQSTLNGHPAYKRVYFSALEGNTDDKSALLSVKKELQAAQDDLDTLNREYDDLALKWTVVKDELNTTESKKMQLEKDNALKDAQIGKLTHNWQTSKTRNKDDIDRTNLMLISKQKSINLLTKNLDKSNKRIKVLKDELDALKPVGIQDNAFSHKSRYRDQHFKNKYYDLNKEHKALMDKFINLSLKTPTPSLSTSSLPSQTESLQSTNIQLLEKQLQTSKAKEQKLVKEVMKFKQLKQDAVKEKEELQAKLSSADATIASLKHRAKKDESQKDEPPPH